MNMPRTLQGGVAGKEEGPRSPDLGWEEGLAGLRVSRRARYVVWCLEVGSWRGDADGLVGAQPCWGAGGYRNPGLWAEDDEGNVLFM